MGPQQAEKREACTRSRGESRWYPPFKHKVENLGDTPYEAVYVGIKGRTAATANRTGPTLAMAEETRKVVAEYLAAAMKP